MHDVVDIYLMQDARRHQEEVAMVLLGKHGGLLASDHRLTELKEV